MLMVRKLIGNQSDRVSDYGTGGDCRRYVEYPYGSRWRTSYFIYALAEIKTT